MHKVKLEELTKDQIQQVVCSASSSKGVKRITLIVDLDDDDMWYSLEVNNEIVEENACLEWIVDKYNEIDI